MTDSELAKFLGIENEPKASAMIAALSPKKRALFERMSQVGIQAELWADGLGPKPVGVLLDFSRKRSSKKPEGLHAAPVGSGPEGETCGSCANLYRRRMARTYLKCELCRSHWTGGFGSDVKARDKACSKWAPHAEA